MNSQACRAVGSWLAVLAAGLMVSAGCGSSSPPAGNSGRLGFASPSMSGGHLPVPEATLSAEDRAWEVFQASRAGDWEAAMGCYGALATDVKHIPRTADNADLIARVEATLRDLHDAIYVHDMPSAMNFSNDITALTALLADPYRKEVPTEAKMLAFYARRLEIFVMSADLRELRESATQMGVYWQQLRPLVVARHATTLADEFGTTVARTLNAQQVTDFIPLVAPAQQQADAIDLLFRTTEED